MVPVLFLLSAAIANPPPASTRFKSALLPIYADTLRSLVWAVQGNESFQASKASADSLITKLVADSGNSEEYENLFWFVRAAGLLARDSVPRAFFDTAPVYALLIEGLGHPDRTVRLKNMDLLVKFGKPFLLAARKAEILEALRRPEVGSAFDPTFYADLLALLPLTAEERARLPFDRRLLSRKVLARLGDSSVEEKLIREFKKSNDLSSKQTLAAELGYVGSQNCARALAEEFFAPLAYRGMGNWTSFQYYAVKALARIYPDEPLLTEEFMYLTTVALNYRADEREVQGIRKHGRRLEQEAGRYFQDILAWLKSNLGITPRHPIPEKPLLTF